MSEECAYHMAVTYSQESASIDRIFIELESDNSFLYNSILQLFTELLTSYMNKMLSDLLMSILKEVTNESLGDQPVITNGLTDERLAQFGYNSNYLEWNASGQMVQYNNDERIARGWTSQRNGPRDAL